MGARVTWNGRGEGVVLNADGLHVTFISTRAFPPGEPVHGTLHLSDGERVFTLKVAGSRREGEGFELRGRLLNATVDIRTSFARAVTET